MYDLEDSVYGILCLWVAIIAFLTAPLWGVPYLVYKALKSRKENKK